MKGTVHTLGGVAAALLLASGSAFAGPEAVSGPGHDPECFAPWNEDIGYLQWEPREKPYKVAVVNGFVGNTWRIQMIQTAKAFVEQPDIAEQIDTFRTVSTGTDVAAQLGAIEDFINQGYDAIVTIAVSPEGFDRAIRLADRNDVVIVPFDNVLDTDKVMQVNEDQSEMGRMYARWLIEQLGENTTGKVLEVRGLPGNSVDRDRHEAFQEEMAAAGDWDIIEVVGNWDDGTAQKVTADAIAVHSEFVGVVVQGGTTGAVRAMLDADHPLVPIAGRVRERLPEAPRRARPGRAERAVGRAVAGARRDRDQGRAGRPRRQRHAAADLGADPVRPLGRARGRQELLAGPDRQLLHRQRVPAVRGEHPGQGHHGEDRRLTDRGRCRRACRRTARRTCA